MPGLEAQLGQMEYSLGAVREQLAAVQRTIADYRKKKTTVAAPVRKVLTNGNEAALEG
jgi:phage shock protein A